MAYLVRVIEVDELRALHSRVHLIVFTIWCCVWSCANICSFSHSLLLITVWLLVWLVIVGKCNETHYDNHYERVHCQPKRESMKQWSWWLWINGKCNICYRVDQFSEWASARQHFFEGHLEMSLSHSLESFAWAKSVGQWLARATITRTRVMS